MDPKYKNYSNKKTESETSKITLKHEREKVIKKAFPSDFYVYVENKNDVTLSIRKEPNGNIIDAIRMKQRVTVVGIHDGWAQITPGEDHLGGFVLAKFLKRIEE